MSSESDSGGDAPDGRDGTDGGDASDGGVDPGAESGAEAASDGRDGTDGGEVTADADAVADADATGGYVHRPGAGDGERAAADEVTTTDGDRTGTGAPAPSGEFDRRGWVLVGAVFLAFFVVPALVLLRPPGVPFRAAMLALPMLPALLLGAVAVWAAAGRS